MIAKLSPRVRQAVAQFEALINSPKTKEEALHRAVAQCSPLLNRFGGPYLVSKPKIGPNFVADFAGKTVGNYNFWTFIEIERAQARLFNKSGRISQALNQALTQIRDWNESLQAGGHGYEGGYGYAIVIGRRRDLSKSDQRALLQENTNRIRTEIMTWDAFVDPLRRGQLSLAHPWSPVLSDAEYRIRERLGELPVWEEQ